MVGITPGYRSSTTAATLFVGPGKASNSTPSVGDNVGFRFVLDGTVQTLSSNHTPPSGQISGLLFVPSLGVQDPCNSVTAPFVPANVTRHNDIWEFGYPAIGLAPWVSVECTKSFLASSQKVGTQALIFFQPSSNNTEIPPPSNDPCWQLNDRGTWKARNDYPVYAIPGPAGTTLMRELSWFSDGEAKGKVDNGSHAIMQHRSSNRLFAMIDINDPANQTPSLWSFILAILGTVLVLGLILMIIYRLLQRRRRQLLHRRIDAGEVDLEYLALNQVKVPRNIVDKMPLYTYLVLTSPYEATLAKDHIQSHVIEVRPESEATSKPLGKEADEADVVLQKPEAAVISSTDTSQADTTKDQFRLSRSQTTCAICLDDFVAGFSMVRELPCGHIFDQGCIDQFLTENSSLCPLCKKSVLPPGACRIRVTDAMVQRDYVARHSQ